MSELDAFIATWDHEARNTAKMLHALPVGQYDFRPDPGGRSLGELAWHLAEIDAYMSHGVTAGTFDFAAKNPGLERPRAIEALAPGYERVHADALERIRTLKLEDLMRVVPFFGDRSMAIGSILWNALLHHMIHHRGQLSLMCRLAGGQSPGIYGPNREEMAALRSG